MAKKKILILLFRWKIKSDSHAELYTITSVHRETPSSPPFFAVKPSKLTDGIAGKVTGMDGGCYHCKRQVSPQWGGDAVRDLSAPFPLQFIGSFLFVDLGLIPFLRLAVTKGGERWVGKLEFFLDLFAKVLCVFLSLLLHPFHCPWSGGIMLPGELWPVFSWGFDFDLQGSVSLYLLDLFTSNFGRLESWKCCLADSSLSCVKVELFLLTDSFLLELVLCFYSKKKLMRNRVMISLGDECWLFWFMFLLFTLAPWVSWMVEVLSFTLLSGSWKRTSRSL